MGRLTKKVIQKFSVLLEEKKESNLKLLKDKILQVNNFLLPNFVLFSYREIVISKHLTLVLAYVSITNNLKLTYNLLDYEIHHQEISNTQTQQQF